jgi:methionyl-tRNA formyltransferase
MDCVKIGEMFDKIVFMGSPEFALPTLQSLARHYTVVGVVTQPDRPAGRGNILTSPPVKQLALKLGLPVIQPGRLKEPGVFEQLQTWNPDLIVVTAFGQILRQNVLDLPRWGCINVHASLLPRWRGAAPIQASILAGDKFTGTTIMKMDAGIDTGAILSQVETRIGECETAGELFSRLAEAGAKLLMDTLPDYLSGKLIPKSQDDSHATYAPMIEKEAGHLDFSQEIELLARKVRAYNPWPSAFTEWQGGLLKIHRAHVVSAQGTSQGFHDVIEGKPAIGAMGGWLVLDEVQPAGKKMMTGAAFLQGARNWIGN